jgi:hypothetical protein
MKNFAIAAAIAVAAFAGSSFVTPSSAEAAYCTARSAYASGWGEGNLNYARRRALRECAIRTPRGYTCYITSCSY